MKPTHIISLLSASVLTLTTAHAALVYQGFDDSTYTNNASLDGNGGGAGFSGNWVQSGSPDVQAKSPGLTYGSLETLGNKVRTRSTTVSRGLASTYLGTDNSEIYFSLLTAEESGYSGSTARFQFGSDSDGYRILNTGTNFQFDVRSGGNIGNSAYVQDLTPSSTSTVLVVGRIIKGTTGNSDSSVQLWVNPSSLGGSAPAFDFELDNLATNNFSSISAVGIAGNAGNFFDEIRIGNDFASVTPIPEPSTLAAISGALAMGLVVLRRRRG